MAFLAFLLAFFCALRSWAVSFLAASVLVGGVSSAAKALKAMKTTAAVDHPSRHDRRRLSVAV